MRQTTMGGETEVFLELLRCLRGTVSVENGHKHMVGDIGTDSIALDRSEVLCANLRHRSNVRASRRNRPGYPHVGHYDTRLTDAYQDIAGATYGVLVYPGWQNSRDNASTPETFGIVPLVSGAVIEEFKYFLATTAERVGFSDRTSEKELCRTILPYVDGINVFPKYEVHNRQYINQRIKAQQIRAATKKLKDNEKNTECCC